LDRRILVFPYRDHHILVYWSWGNISSGLFCRFLDVAITQTAPRNQREVIPVNIFVVGGFAVGMAIIYVTGLLV
jgi:hypothetical protein